MNLAQLEALFWRAARADKPPKEIDTEFVGDDRASAVRRMNVYHKAYWHRQVLALRELFPRLTSYLGEPLFHRISTSYLEAMPSERPALEWIGSRFAEYLATHAELPHCAAELARLEWARSEVLMAPDPASTVQIDDLRGLDFARARARLGPAVRVLSVPRYAVHTLEASAPADALHQDHDHSAVGCVVWRQRERVHHRTLSETEHAALTLLQAGHDFASVCGAFDGPDAATEAARAIGSWIRCEWLSTLEI